MLLLLRVPGLRQKDVSIDAGMVSLSVEKTPVRRPPVRPVVKDRPGSTAATDARKTTRLHEILEVGFALVGKAGAHLIARLACLLSTGVLR